MCVYVYVYYIMFLYEKQLTPTMCGPNAFKLGQSTNVLRTSYQTLFQHLVLQISRKILNM